MVIITELVVSNEAIILRWAVDRTLGRGERREKKVKEYNATGRLGTTTNDLNTRSMDR